MSRRHTVHITTAPSSHILLRHLFERMSYQHNDVFDQSWVVIPNYACRRWIEQTMAKTFGICSQVQFMQAGSLTWEIVRNSENDVNTGYQPHLLTWQLLDEKQIDLADYDHAKHLASCLNRYIHERPEWIIQWEQGINDQHSHAKKWLSLVNQLGGQHQVRILNKESLCVKPSHLPCSLHIFLPEQLTPLFLLCIDRVAQWIPVSMYVVNPVKEDYWFKIASPKQQAYAKRKSSTSLTDHHVLVETGNKLLAILGKQKANLLDYLMNQSSWEFHHINQSETNLGGSLLGSIRHDIHQQLARPEKHIADNSIQIHACHSRRREVETIKDVILQYLKDNIDSEPYHILVVAPDINQYKLWIDEIFDCKPSLDYYIDRLRIADHETTQSLLFVLDNINNKMGNQDIFQLLDYVNVRKKFGLLDEDVSSIKDWIHESNILWGYDAEHKESFGGEATPSNSWKQGVRRWLHGYLKGSSYDKNDLYLATFGDHEGTEIIFAAFFDLLDHWYLLHQKSRDYQTLQQWYGWLYQVQTDLLGIYDERFDSQLFKYFMDSSCANKCVSYQVMSTIVKEALADHNYRSVGETGVRFQSWENACIANAKLVVVMGMNHGEFPQQDTRDIMDLTDQNPHPLGRNTYLRDKNLWLNLLSEPLDMLAVSYQGYSSVDNTTLQPSSVVSHIIDYLQVKTDGVFDIMHHKMHGFSPIYFMSSEETSFSEYNYKRLPTDYIEKVRIPQREPLLQGEYILSLNQIQKFASDPQTYFFRQIASINQSIEKTLPDTMENYQVDSLLQWQLNQQLYSYPDDACILQKSELIPQDITGQFLTDEYRHDRSSQLSSLKLLSQKKIQVEIDKYTISGSIWFDELGRPCTVLLKKLSIQNLIEHWMMHLLWYYKSGDKVSVINALDCSIKVDLSEISTNFLLDWLVVYTKHLQEPWGFVPNAAMKLSSLKLSCTSVAEYQKHLNRNSRYVNHAMEALRPYCEDFSAIEQTINTYFKPLVQSSDFI